MCPFLVFYCHLNPETDTIEVFGVWFRIPYYSPASHTHSLTPHSALTHSFTHSLTIIANLMDLLSILNGSEPEQKPDKNSLGE